MPPVIVDICGEPPVSVYSQELNDQTYRQNTYEDEFVELSYFGHKPVINIGIINTKFRELQIMTIFTKFMCPRYISLSTPGLFTQASRAYDRKIHGIGQMCDVIINTTSVKLYLANISYDDVVVICDHNDSKMYLFEKMQLMIDAPRKCCRCNNHLRANKLIVLESSQIFCRKCLGICYDNVIVRYKYIICRETRSVYKCVLVGNHSDVEACVYSNGYRTMLNREVIYAEYEDVGSICHFAPNMKVKICGDNHIIDIVMPM